jgi:hypothetical protein
MQFILTYCRYLLVLIFIPGYVNAQFFENLVLSENQMQNANSLYLNVNTANYFINQEFFNPMSFSYTLAGYHFAPSIKYQLTDQLQLQAGAYILNSFGRDELLKLRPAFSINYQVFENFRFELGSRISGFSHRLPEQVYSLSQGFTENHEEGIRALYCSDHVFFDVWLDWRSLTLPRDDFPEKIFAGYSAAWNSDIEKKVNLKLFSQFMTYHVGGQDLVILSPVETYLYLINGYQISYQATPDLKLGNKSFYIQFINAVPRENFPFDKGYVMATELFAQWQFIHFETGYCYANRFYNPIGDFQFASVSVRSNLLIQPIRNMVYARLNLQKSISNYLVMGVQSGFYYSENLNSTDYYLGLYLSFNQDFLLLQKHAK